MKVMGKFVVAVSILFCAAFLILSPAQAAPAQPSPSAQPTQQQTASDVVKEFYAALVDTMKEGPALGVEGRYQKLEPAITKAFNLPLMARYAVGPAWAQQTPENQKKLTHAFSAFSIATYASRFTKFDGETFTVIDEKPMPNGAGFMVHTQLKPKDGDAVTLNYLVRPDENGTLRIADVYLDASISELATRRAEFSSVIKREGFDALVTSLEQKVTKMKEPKTT